MPTPNHHDGLEDVNQASLSENLAQPLGDSARESSTTIPTLGKK